MNYRVWNRGAVIAGAIAAAAAGVMAFRDWSLNPSGVFRGPAGTAWPAVWETWLSWFFPLLALAAMVVMPIVFWRARRSRNSERVT